MPTTLILGGNRSGKSRHAQSVAESHHLPVTYLATATPHDPEMRERIRLHQGQRPPHWHTVEEPLHLAATLTTHARSDRVILVECLTLWLNNLLHAGETVVQSQAEIQRLLHVLPQLPGHILLVSNEIGLGVIPLGEGTRHYVDTLGTLHQQIAALADRVTLVVAGLPLHLKG